MSAQINRKLLDQLYDALNDRRFNPKSLGATIALEYSQEMNRAFFEVILAYLKVAEIDYKVPSANGLNGNIPEIAHAWLDCYDPEVLT